MHNMHVKCSTQDGCIGVGVHHVILWSEHKLARNIKRKLARNIQHKLALNICVWHHVQRK